MLIGALTTLTVSSTLSISRMVITEFAVLFYIVYEAFRILIEKFRNSAVDGNAPVVTTY